jgi:diguanylate cyclase (GGDEF)-like protein
MNQSPGAWEDRAFGGAGGWRHLSKRIRRLSLLQLGAVVVLGVLMIVSVVVIERSVDRENAAQDRQERFHRDLTDARHLMRVQESQFWQFRAAGGEGLPPSFVLAALAGGERVRDLASQDPAPDDPVKRAASRDVIASLDALARLLQQTDPNERSGSPEDRRTVRRATALIGAVSANFGRWVERDAVLRISSSKRQDSLTSRLDLALLALVGAFVIGSVLLWILVQRGQRRMLDALDDAAHRLAGLAASDPLTSLANHGEFHSRMVDEVQRARRHGRDLSIVLLDLDHFKEVNDTRGHQVGDAVLVEAARRLSRLGRQGDLIGRVGGEEFGWLLPETSVLEAFQAAERARREIGGTPFAGAGTITISAGVADLADASGAEDLYQLADSALYWAKAHGRDVTFRYSAEVADALGDAQGTRSVRAQTLASLRSLARAIDSRQPSGRHHSDRVAEVAARLATETGWSREAADELREAAQLLHLGRVSALDEASSQENLRDEVLLSVEMARAVLSNEQRLWLRHRAERWDGRGVPDGLVGEGIPGGSAIIAVAHAWERLTVATAPDERLSSEAAHDRIVRESGHAFSPGVVAALEHCLQQAILPLDYRGATAESEKMHRAGGSTRPQA